MTDPETPPPPLESGAIIDGRYELVRNVGTGGMAHVWKARHRVIGNAVAFKVLREAITRSPGAVERVLRGARNAGRLQHPNVCMVFDVGTLPDGGRYLAMEFVEGPTLQGLLADGPLSVRDALEIALGVSRALTAAHELGIIHRDLKPDNVMLQGGRRTAAAVKVVDFDIARAPDDEADVAITRAMDTIGTPQYMSPEQCRGVPLDPRSDLYSLGLILYRMLSGTLPFSGRNTREMMARRLTDPPRPLREAASGRSIPEEVIDLVDRLLAREPVNRIASSPAVVSVVERLLQKESDRVVPPAPVASSLVAPASARLPPEDSSITGTGTPTRRWAIPTATAGIAGLVLIGSALLHLGGDRTTDTASDAASPPASETAEPEVAAGLPGDTGRETAAPPETPSEPGPVEEAHDTVPDVLPSNPTPEPATRFVRDELARLPSGPEISVVLLPQEYDLTLPSEVEPFLEQLGSVLARGEAEHLRTIYPGVLEREVRFWLDEFRGGLDPDQVSVSLAPRAVDPEVDGVLDLRVVLVTILERGEPARALSVRARLERHPEHGFQVLELLRL